MTAQGRLQTFRSERRIARVEYKDVVELKKLDEERMRLREEKYRALDSLNGDRIIETYEDFDAKSIQVGLAATDGLLRLGQILGKNLKKLKQYAHMSGKGSEFQNLKEKLDQELEEIKRVADEIAAWEDQVEHEGTIFKLDGSEGNILNESIGLAKQLLRDASRVKSEGNRAIRSAEESSEEAPSKKEESASERLEDKMHNELSRIQNEAKDLLIIIQIVIRDLVQSITNLRNVNQATRNALGRDLTIYVNRMLKASLEKIKDELKYRINEMKIIDARTAHVTR